jgi:uncharacterized protein YggE
MKKRQLFWIGILLISVIGCNQTVEKDKSQSYVEVTGTAEKEIDPDIFYLSISLSETNSQKNNINTLEQKMLDVLKSLNIDTQSNLSVTGMSGDNWYWWRRSRTVYQNKSYQLKTTSLDTLNKVCDKLDSMGYVNYYLTKTDYSKKDELKKEVQQEAVKQARIKAENLLSGEDRKVDELIYLQERETYSPVPMYGYVQNENKSAADKEEYQSSVSFNKKKISYDIVARFSIK